MTVPKELQSKIHLNVNETFLSKKEGAHTTASAAKETLHSPSSCMISRATPHHQLDMLAFRWARSLDFCDSDFIESRVCDFEIFESYNYRWFISI